ncbi:TonB-dependent receptor plug domain-containing protein [Desulfosarcina ovata]|uniref:TonB-dependent receptor plug domain-containing protein n=1 Tax=Desulfosarcina ovata TaxID=83564 RepID=UPI001563A119|nr:TonB-dependent receptor [Desulfosarcina ovata]
MRRERGHLFGLSCRPLAGKMIILIAGLLVLYPLMASADSDGEQPYTLGEIVVTSDREGEARGLAIDPTATSIVIDTYESAKTPQTVQDILESMAGVDIQRGDSTLSDGKDVVKIRGMGARRILVRIDGRPIRNAGGFWDKLVDWNSLTLENVERVEVVRGGHSAVYGETIGGTINIVTKKGSTRDDNRPEAKAMVDVSEYGTRKYTAGVAGNVNALGYAFGGAYRESDGFLKNSAYELKDVNGRISYTFPFDGRLTFGYKGSFQEKEPYVVNDPDNALVGDLYDSDYPIVEGATSGSSINYPGSDSFEERETEYFDLFFEQPSPIGDWKLHFYKSEEFRDVSHYNYSSSYGLFYDYPWDVNFEDWGWIIHDRFTLLDRHDVTIGMEGREYEIGYNAYALGQEWHVPQTKMITHQAAFIEDIWQVTDKLSLALGLRYDRVDMDVDIDFAGYDDYTKDMDAWSPKSRLNYTFRPGTTGYVNVSKAFRIPTGMEFTWMGAPTGLFIDPETAMEYEGGIIQKLARDITARMGYYYYKIDNYIMFNRDPYPLLYSGRIEDAVFNADYLILQGVEAELRFSLSDRLNGYINYTYQDSELGDTRVPEDQLYDDHYQLPRHKASLGVDYAVLENTILLANVRYVDKRKTSFDQEIDAFTTMDLAVEQRFWNQQAHVKLYVTNLFDADYEEQYLVPAPDRVFGVNLGFKF